MVHEKQKSGDPDYDDKVPADQHVGRMVIAGDGREVLITEANGPVNLDGSHANLDDPKGEAGDNRPAPGEVATKASEVQTYDTKAMPAKNLGTANSSQELDDLLAQDGQETQELSSQQSGDQARAEQVEAEQSAAPAAKPARTRTAK